MKPHIMIIGAGRIGSAIAFLLKEYSPVMWDVNETRLRVQIDCNLEMSRANVIFICAPTASHHAISKKISECADKSIIVVSLAKGLSEKGELVPEIMSSYFNSSQIGILCGPMMSEEILSGQPSFAVLATRSTIVKKVVEKIFKKINLLLQFSDDVNGVAWLSVIKNIYAILYGASVGLGFGTNMQGYLMSRITFESELFLKMIKSSTDLFHTPAGIGDLYCTVSSPHSRNRGYGIALTTNDMNAPIGEGAKAVCVLKNKLGKKFNLFPLLAATHDLVSGKKPLSIFSKLMNRV